MKSGPLESITIKGRRFAVAEDDTTNINLGGKNNEVYANGDGTVRVQQSRVPSSVEGINIIFDPDKDDDGYLSEIKETGDLFDCSITANDGTIFSGSMQLIGDLIFDLTAGKLPITLKGTMQKQG